MRISPVLIIGAFARAENGGEVTFVVALQLHVEMFILAQFFGVESILSIPAFKPLVPEQSPIRVETLQALDDLISGVQMPGMTWLFIISLLVLANFLWVIHSSIKNYSQARTLNFPILINPLTPLNPIWSITHRLLLSYLKSAPWGFFYVVRYCYPGWPYEDKYCMHEEIGRAFVVVAIDKVDVHIADGQAVDSIFARRNDFPKTQRII